MKEFIRMIVNHLDIDDIQDGLNAFIEDYESLGLIDVMDVFPIYLDAKLKYHEKEY